ncbi:hypothetical protein [Mangrovimonas sp. TPBH4]|uniref:hypothetical protein n=1 Tax=Mangrovimonas sp. TPBH4 TaxID=1645914 RepID=UPI0006B4F1C8|nr:hypothetical protein [Mangrovimonas sp. TPBH4]
MDELELLKKDWNKSGTTYPKLSYNDIYKMILKKSSSIVKWIFILSMLEFVFWLGISFLLKDSKNLKSFNELDGSYLLIPLSVIGYVVLAYFFFLFYKNYRKISVTDSAKQLMENILKTRRTVKQYVAFNLIYMLISSFVLLFIEFDQNQDLIAKVQEASANGHLLMFYTKVILTFTVVFGLVILILLGFYWLVYGILLRKLNRNYHELKKLEI